MAYRPQQIANYLIDKARAEGISLTPMQLIKMVYIAHGWNLAIYDSPLIDEKIEAWRYGPVVSSLYHDLKIYGNNPITDYAGVFKRHGSKIGFVEPEIPENDMQTLSLLDRIWDVYKKYSGTQLSSMTHEKGSPWHDTIHENLHNGYFPMGLVISDERIKEHYRNKATSS